MRVNGDGLLIVKKNKCFCTWERLEWFLRLESNDFIKTLQIVFF